METFDFLVIGGGSAGLSAAVGAAKFGLKVGLVEKGQLGGDCLWTGCVPSKSLIHSAKIAHTLDNAKDYGFYDVGYNTMFKDVIKRVWDVIHSIERNDSPETVKSKGVTPIFGEASFVSKNMIEAGGKRYKAKKFLIAAGSRAFIPPIKGIENIEYLTNENLFHLQALPKSLIVAGGGPIGVEMAQAFLRLGSEVIVVHSGPNLLNREDDDVAQELQKILKSEGLKVITNSRVEEVERDGIRKVVYVTDKTSKKKTKVTASALLVATGRVKNLDLNLEAAGVVYDPKGGIKVDKFMRTSAKHIYAAGDCTDCPYMFTHVADYHAGIAVGHALFKLRRKADYTALPWVTFTDPELARVGLSEKECVDKGIKYKAYRVDFKDVDRAEAEGETRGFMKTLVSPKGKILGAHILGVNGGELLGEMTLAISQGVSITKLASVIHAYPTLSRVVRKVSGQYLSDQLEQKPWIKRVAKWLF
ncbi:MAG: dihydrolipoyl dehydrogenase family protein [Candidatus Nanoarchaeia archaeon]